MECTDIKPGMKVRTTELGNTIGMFIAEKNLTGRKTGVTGTVLRYVPGHGGEVWFVQHDGSEDVAAYMFDEMEPA